MSYVRPKGILKADLSASPDVVAYRVYFSTNPEELAVTGFNYNREYVEADFTPNSTDPDTGDVIPGFVSLNLDEVTLPEIDGELYFAVVAVDDNGNLSSPSEALAITIDSEPPVPPTNLRFEPAQG